MKISIPAIAAEDIHDSGLLLVETSPGHYAPASVGNTPVAVSAGTAKPGGGFSAYALADDVFTLVASEVIARGDVVQVLNGGRVGMVAGGVVVGRALTDATVGERVQVSVDLIEEPVTAVELVAGVPHSPADGKLYARRMASWEALPDNLTTDPPNDGKTYVRQSAAWVHAPTIRVGEAPETGKMYARRGGQWVELDSTLVPDGPRDGKLYGRQGGAWSLVPAESPVGEAPVDGNLYARQTGAWVQIAATQRIVWTQKIEAQGDQLASECDTLLLTADEDLELFHPTTPAIADGVYEGQQLTLTVGAGCERSVTIQSVSEYTNAGVVLKATQRVLRNGRYLVLAWTGAVWAEVSWSG